MSAVFCKNEKQRKLAEETRAAEAKRRGQKITTQVLPLNAFWLAEDYHQKYYLRLRTELFKEMRGRFATEQEFLNSTAVARVNAYLGGRGSRAQLQEEIDSFGLSPAARQTLLDAVGRRSR